MYSQILLFYIIERKLILVVSGYVNFLCLKSCTNFPYCIYNGSIYILANKNT